MHKPKKNKYYSPSPYGGMVKTFVREDGNFWYFSDGVKHSKSLPFLWHEVEKPRYEENKKTQYPYNCYSDWSKQIAKLNTVEEIEKIILECEKYSDKYARQHLAAIESTTSMQSQSQRRAQTRNNVTANYEKKRAYQNALEIKKYYPEK